MNVNERTVLSLNKNWGAIGIRSIKEAIIALNGGDGDTPPALALDMDFPLLQNGQYDFAHPIYLNPVRWLEWITLPIRPFDDVIHSASLKIRVPTVIISTNYTKMPLKKPRISRNSIYERDNGECCYTGRKLSKHSSSIDHIHPKSRGGKDTWENLVLCDKKINTLKGDKLPHEVGLKLLRKPKEPPSVPVSLTIKKYHPTWAAFLLHEK